MSRLPMLLLMCGVAVSVTATPFSDCGSSSTVTSLELVGCDTLPCILVRGETSTLNVQLVAGSATTSLVSSIAGILNGVTVPFSTDDKACDSLTSGSCPLAATDQFGFTTTVDVLPEYPPVAVTIQWKLKDDSGSDMACALIPARIQ